MNHTRTGRIVPNVAQRRPCRPTSCDIFAFLPATGPRWPRSGQEVLPFAQFRPDFVKYESRRSLRQLRSVRRAFTVRPKECIKFVVSSEAAFRHHSPIPASPSEVRRPMIRWPVRLTPDPILAAGGVPDPRPRAGDDDRRRREGGGPGNAVITRTKPQTKKPN